MASNASEHDRQNFGKLCRIIVEQVRDIMYDILCHYIPHRDDVPHLVKDHITELNFYKERKAIIENYCETDGLFQNHLDVTAVNRIVTKVKLLDETVTIDKKYMKEVNKLTDIRNDAYAHVSLAAVSDETYQSIFKKISQIFGRLDEYMRREHVEQMYDYVEKIYKIDKSLANHDLYTQQFRELEEFTKETRRIANKNTESIEEKEGRIQQLEVNSDKTDERLTALERSREEQSGPGDLHVHGGVHFHGDVQFHNDRTHVTKNENFNTINKSEEKETTNRGSFRGWKCSTM